MISIAHTVYPVTPNAGMFYQRGCKTKVIHFRPTTKPRSDYAFKCGDKLIEYETLYKYLGFWFNETLDMKKSIKEISKAASRAHGAVYMKFISFGGMTFNVYSKLIEFVVLLLRDMGA